MLKWAIIFLVIAVLAAFLGFGGVITGTAVWFAQILFVLFIILFVLSLVGVVKAPPIE
jgi:uncharacterized membrane protein YtjA (UPF0391 family)